MEGLSGSYLLETLVLAILLQFITKGLIVSLKAARILMRVLEVWIPKDISCWREERNAADLGIGNIFVLGRNYREMGIELKTPGFFCYLNELQFQVYKCEYMNNFISTPLDVVDKIVLNIY